MNSFPGQFNVAYFWDIDISKLDIVKSKRLIIERVLNFGNIKEIQYLMSIYDEKEIKHTICTLNYIDPKTLNFLSVLFDIPKNKFKCYSKKQLTLQPSIF